MSGRPSDGMSLDELREEFDWISDFQSRMAERIRGDADVHNLADYVGKLERENADLRELVRIAVEYCANGYCAEEDECPLYESRTSCSLYAKARDLGIEVDG